MGAQRGARGRRLRRSGVPARSLPCCLRQNQTKNRAALKTSPSILTRAWVPTPPDLPNPEWARAPCHHHACSFASS